MESEAAEPTNAVTSVAAVVALPVAEATTPTSTDAVNGDTQLAATTPDQHSAGSSEATDATAAADDKEAAKPGRFAFVGTVAKKVRVADHSKFVAGLLIGGLGTFSAMSFASPATTSASGPVAAQLAQLRADVLGLKGTDLGMVAASTNNGAKPGPRPVAPGTTTHSTAAAPNANAFVAWNYSTADRWGALSSTYATCRDGSAQSPIALESGDVRRYAGQSNFVYEPHATSVSDTGHGVVLKSEGGGALKLGERTYRLDEVQLHMPSEHTIDGERFLLEIQLVHNDAENHVAVASIMVRSGPSLDAMDQIVASIPSVGKMAALTNAFDATTLLPKSRDLFKYDGSLTAPPCTEGVAWLVFTEPITMSDTQLAKLKEHIREPNNRPLQALNGRGLHVEVDLSR